MSNVTLDIVSDVMCPWCWVGKRRLEEALARAPNREVDIRWRPFQLDPTLPKQGRPRADYLAEKFGSLERARELYANIKAAGEQTGIPFEFDAITVSPNTLDAHRLIRWSSSTPHHDAVVERLFELYFLEGAHIGDNTVLAGAARDAGMDGDLVAELLASDQDADLVRREIALAQQMGINGVPAFIVANKYLLSGAQPAEAFLEVFTRLDAEGQAAPAEAEVAT